MSRWRIVQDMQALANQAAACQPGRCLPTRPLLANQAAAAEKEKADAEALFKKKDSGTDSEGGFMSSFNSRVPPPDNAIKPMSSSRRQSIDGALKLMAVTRRPSVSLHDPSSPASSSQTAAVVQVKMKSSALSEAEQREADALAAIEAEELEASERLRAKKAERVVLSATPAAAKSSAPSASTSHPRAAALASAHSQKSVASQPFVSAKKNSTVPEVAASNYCNNLNMYSSSSSASKKKSFNHG